MPPLCTTGGILFRHSIPYNVRHRKCLEIPSFQTIRHGKYPLAVEAPTLWNIIDNKYMYKDVADLKSFKASIYGLDQDYVFILSTMCSI